jgi:phosphoglycolate phosphatase-like HAD superfamily hydrolase
MCGTVSATGHRARYLKMLKYRCLILDHDDTAIDGTAAVHYPAHVRAMEILRPGVKPVDLAGWFKKNFDPGIMAFLRGELGMTEVELKLEYNIWREFTSRAEPQFYPGFLDALAEYKDRGGRIAVVSHSESDIIRGHYGNHGHGLSVVPDLIFGWELGEGKRKPSPYPLFETLRIFGLEPWQALVIDDLKPGVEMAEAAHVPVAAAGWAHQIPEIRTYMEAHSVVYLETIEAFRDFILG